MKTIILAAAVAAGLPVAAFAQDTTTTTTTTTTSDTSASRTFEPYVGVLAGYHSFDKQSEFGTSGPRGKMDGYVISGVGGVNVPLGSKLFVGVEGNATKGFKDIDWEYGVKARGGIQTPTGGLLFLSAGYQWVNGKGNRGFADHSDWMWGGGVEIGPKDLGMSGYSDNGKGPRLRLQVDTYDFDSIRPMAGVVFAF